MRAHNKNTLIPLHIIIYGFLSPEKKVDNPKPNSRDFCERNRTLYHFITSIIYIRICQKSAKIYAALFIMILTVRKLPQTTTARFRSICFGGRVRTRGISAAVLKRRTKSQSRGTKSFASGIFQFLFLSTVELIMFIGIVSWISACVVRLALIRSNVHSAAK